MAAQVPSFKDNTYLSFKNVSVKDLQYKSHTHTHTHTHTSFLNALKNRGMICTHFPSTCFPPLNNVGSQFTSDHIIKYQGGFGTSILQDLISLKYKQL